MRDPFILASEPYLGRFYLLLTLTGRRLTGSSPPGFPPLVPRGAQILHADSPGRSVPAFWEQVPYDDGLDGVGRDVVGGRRSAYGGHWMIFRTFEGALKLTLHQPNKGPWEQARIFDLQDEWAYSRLGKGEMTWV